MTEEAPGHQAQPAWGQKERALHGLLIALKARGYAFVTPSPRTHARVIARPYDPHADPLRDLFGWSRPVPHAAVDSIVLDLLEAGGGLIAGEPGMIASRYRVSSEGANLYLHSAYPTSDADSVFFGPDSYRFAAWLRRRLRGTVNTSRLAEIGAGTGIGALTAARMFPGTHVLLTDINPAALRLARLNAAAAEVSVNARLTSGLDAVARPLDLIVANPPYMIDPDRRAYRHGGADYGAQVALDWTRAALNRLRPGGRFLLYSGAPVVRGEDILLSGLRRIARETGARLDYEELDPDVWGEELETPAYARVERIAVAGAELAFPGMR